MKLYLLRPVVPWEPWYDKAFGFVVRAHDEQEARALAQGNGGDEVRYWDGGHLRDRLAWIDPKESTCVELSADGPLEIVIRDFTAA